ncbi:AraC family transcriptional regulator [Actinokineospora spheciospongiae]|nr:AraC family transcriptional regulator [Actinokineospora spheciospongiae]
MTHPAGRAVLPVEAGWDQFICAEAGAMTVSTPAGVWAVPVGRGLWVPDGAPATVGNRAGVAVRTLYFDSTLGTLPGDVRVVTVTDWARALVLHTVRTCPLDLADPVHAALLTVLTAELRMLPAEPLRLSWPRDPRATAAATGILADATADLDAVARRVGVGRRTLERLFVAETGLGLGAWRRRAHVLASLDLLASGASVTAASVAAGYTTPSAFVVAFKAELGRTPRQFLPR